MSINVYVCVSGRVAPDVSMALRSLAESVAIRPTDSVTCHVTLDLDTEPFKCIKYNICYYAISVIDCATCAARVMQLCCLLFDMKITYYVERALEVGVNNMLGILLPASLTDYL
jgi:hypothetical protein